MHCELRFLPLLYLLHLLWCNCSNKLSAQESASNPTPLQVTSSNTDLPNFHKVTDTLYRSGQPTQAGMKQLKEFGITTIVNLRSFSSDRDEIGTTGLAYEHIYMKAWHPEEKEAIRFLQIVTDPKRTPILVHCHYGSDRTGTMIALYRMAVQCWTSEDAIREMSEGGFGFNKIWFNLPQWLESLDIAAIRAQSGIVVGPPRPPIPAVK